MNKINISNYNDLKSWPFKEAQQILKRNGGLSNFKIPKKGHILLETGYRLVQEVDATGEDYNFLMAENLLDQIILETGFGLLLESQPEQVDYDDRTDAENVFIETQADDFIDFSTGDPFSEGGRF